jgi:hypothetical protein
LSVPDIQTHALPHLRAGVRASIFEEDPVTAKKQKEKERRRARKLAEQAWEAANDANLDLALKIMRRAADTQPDNPVLWNDLGVLLLQAGDLVEAERAFRAAQSLAIGYAEPFANLATIRLCQGRLEAAVALQERAVDRAPDSALHAERLAAYRAMLNETPAVEAPPAVQPEPPADDTDWAGRLAELDWHALSNRLTREGCAVIAGLVDAQACATARSWWADDSLFAKTVVMNRPDFGVGSYRYFKAPLPPLVEGLRRAFYPHAARVANQWQQLLGEATSFPEDWDGFRDVCRDAGQSASTPILIRYEAGGFNALHRDLRGEVYFPLQLAIVLSPLRQDDEADGFEGGEFTFADVPEGPRSQRRQLRAGLGDAILFCTRDRLVSNAGGHRLQPVMHGVSPITAGTRTVLGIPFHEYR